MTLKELFTQITKAQIEGAKLSKRIESKWERENRREMERVAKMPRGFFLSHKDLYEKLRGLK